MKFIIISLCVFLLFHIVGYCALLKTMLQSSRAKLFMLFVVIVHFILLLVFTIILFAKIDVPSIIYIPLSLTLLISMLFFVAGVINFVLILIFKNHRIHISMAMFVITIIAISYSIYNASKAPTLTKEDIYLPNLKNEMSILMITDLHISRLLPHRKIQQIIDLANASKPDVIVLVGDILDSPASVAQGYLHYLAELKAKYGVYYVLGNHEYLIDVNKDLELMRSLPNVKVLLNQNVVIDDNVNLVGVSDLIGIKKDYLEPDLKSALKGINTTLPTILLSHQPNIIKYINSKIDLVLSGHTHGGQIFPFSIGVYFANPFLYGLKNINDTQLYISQGSHLSVTYGRLGTQSEINLLTLKKEKK